MMAAAGKFEEVYCSTILASLCNSYCSIHPMSFSSSRRNRSTAAVKQNPDFPEVWSGSWIFFSSNQMSLATDHCSLGPKLIS